MSTQERPRRILRILGVFISCILAVPLLAVSSIDAQTEIGLAGNKGSSDGADPIAASGDDEKPQAYAIDSIGDSDLAELANNPSLAPANATTNVEVHGPDLDAVRAAISTVGGEAYGEVPDYFVEARVPIAALDTLNEQPAVGRLSQVTRVSHVSSDDSLGNNPALQSVLASSVSLEAWHSAGHTGAGQRIGVLDLFGTDELGLALERGRLPAPAGTFCQSNGRSCSITVDNGGAHGVAVAEIIHQAAPEAELYLATVVTTADLRAAVEWFGEQGVTVINRSETSQLDGPGDGTGPTAAIVDRAVELDMVWVAAGGNAAGRGNSLGQNWVGRFNDPDGNGFHNFENGEERMAFSCGFILGMRWDDDWDTSIPTDYDVWIYDTASSSETEARGDDAQNSQNHVPLEHVNTRCSSDNDIDYLSIRLFEDLAPDGLDEIQILGNQTVMEEWTNEHSATGPGNDSASPGAIVVGATEDSRDNTVADFSSHGPTFDGRTGIDLIAPSCLPIPDFFDFCFSGTSSSAPVVGGIVGVLRGAGLIASAEDVDALLPSLTTDAGDPGPDTQYGRGFLTLPSPQSLGVQPTVRCNNALVTIVGTSGNDELIGTSGPDVFLAGPGNDRIIGRGGADIICAGAGNDVIIGGRGSDTIIGGSGADTIEGNRGSDTIIGGSGADIIEGNRGNDTINAGFGADDVAGNTGNDVLIGFNGNDFLRGGSGLDEVRGGPGEDRVYGGPDEDLVFGGADADMCPDAFEHSSSCRVG